MTGTDWTGTILFDTAFNACHLSEARFVDICWTNFAISEANFSETVFAPTEIERGVMMQCDFSGLDLCRTSLKNCTFNASTFGGVTAKRALIDGCLFGLLYREQQLDFSSIAYCSFTRSNITATSFDASNLRRILML